MHHIRADHRGLRRPDQISQSGQMRICPVGVITVWCSTIPPSLRGRSSQIAGAAITCTEWPRLEHGGGEAVTELCCTAVVRRVVSRQSESSCLFHDGARGSVSLSSRRCAASTSAYREPRVQQCIARHYSTQSCVLLLIHGGGFGWSVSKPPVRPGALTSLSTQTPRCTHRGAFDVWH